jgi:uncharacterized protein (DUF1810 family)
MTPGQTQGSEIRNSETMTNPTDSSNLHDTHSNDDTHNLSRFLQAQEHTYEQALSEIKSGRKRTHWMWFIFPQIKGLSSSSTAELYSIKSVEEARAYLNHPVLGTRLRECAEATINIEGRSANEVFGSPDDLKLRSCATLFAYIAPSGSVFERLIGKFYDSESDERTLKLLHVIPTIPGAGDV